MPKPVTQVVTALFLNNECILIKTAISTVHTYFFFQIAHTALWRSTDSGFPKANIIPILKSRKKMITPPTTADTLTEKKKKIGTVGTKQTECQSN